MTIKTIHRLRKTLLLQSHNMFPVLSPQRAMSEGEGNEAGESDPGMECRHTESPTSVLPGSNEVFFHACDKDLHFSVSE